MRGNAGETESRRAEVEETRWNPLARNAKTLQRSLRVYNAEMRAEPSIIHHRLGKMWLYIIYSKLIQILNNWSY